MSAEATVFKYQRPAELKRSKTIVDFFRGDIMNASVQVVREGGENNLHKHPTQDGFWMVLAGQVNFYGAGDKLLAELHPSEGIHIPRGFPYWFESTGETALELLHVVASVPGAVGPARVDVEGHKAEMADHVDAGARHVNAS